MAEIAIPILVLGSMYIMTNQNQKKENYENLNNDPVPEGIVPRGIPVNPVQNYPVQKYKELGGNTSFYPSPNAATDRYFQQDVYENEVERTDKPSNNQKFKSLTGNSVHKKDIKFNNMVPYFGAKISGQTFDYDKGAGQSILDNKAGTGKQYIKKKAQAPLFKPAADMNWSHGTPNMSDFYQSRMNPSTKISNNKPWEEVRVGPGLNQGYSAEGTNGFNAGMMARKEWLPKNVDQLRNVTNPKVTFGLANHEGPANSIIKSRGIEGRVEKQRPDTYYNNTPDRWFTTGGQEKAQTARSEQPMQPVNRTFTTREYYGTGGGDVNGAEKERIEPTYEKSKRIHLEGPVKHLGGAHNLNKSNGWANVENNYGGHHSRPNARSTTEHREQIGIVSGWMKAAIAPVLDVLRPSRKENVIGNLRPIGNVQGAYGVEQAHVWNPADKTKTTIKEQTAVNKYQPQANYNHGGGYATNEYQPIENQRQTTNCPIVGPAGATPWSQKSVSQAAERNAHLNPNREVVSKSRANGGNMDMFNSNMNIKSSKIGNMHSSQGMADMPKQGSNASNVGSIGYRNNRDSMVEMRRTEGDLLNAFNSNPFTHSLSSVA